jgi:hypothetical protein
MNNKSKIKKKKKKESRHLLGLPDLGDIAVILELEPFSPRATVGISAALHNPDFSPHHGDNWGFHNLILGSLPHIEWCFS